MSDRPYFEFSSSSERTTKRVTWGAGKGPARSSHVVYKKSWRSVSTGAYSVVGTRWYTINMSNADMKYGINTYAILSGFFTIVWTRQEYTSWHSYLCDTYCCCITGTCTCMYNMQNNTGRQRHGFSVGIEIDLVVVWMVEIDLLSVWGIGMHLISV